MTDDLDRRIDARIARALRMLADEADAKSLNSTVAVCRIVADSLDPPEPALKPCPFCGSKPYQTLNGNVSCDNHRCWMSGGEAPIAEWNRRVEVPHG